MSRNFFFNFSLFKFKKNGFGNWTTLSTELKKSKMFYVTIVGNGPIYAYFKFEVISKKILEVDTKNVKNMGFENLKILKE